MEIYECNQVVKTICSFFARTTNQIFIGGVIGGGLLWLILFILHGIGLYTMAKKRGISKKFLAFVPFANIWYVGKLAGECKVFGRKMKRAGMYAMIAQIVTTILSCAAIAAELYLYLRHGDPIVTDDPWATPYWGLMGFSGKVESFYDFSGFLISIAQMIFRIFMLIILLSFYKQYAPKHYFMLSVLVFFVPSARFVTAFCLKNKTPIDYEAYMRARHEAYMRRQQQYYNQYGNPYNGQYGGGYNNPYANPYQQNPNPQSQGKSPDDPFEEFSSQANSDEPFSEMGDKSDDFFS